MLTAGFICYIFRVVSGSAICAYECDLGLAQPNVEPMMEKSWQKNHHLETLRSQTTTTHCHDTENGASCAVHGSIINGQQRVRVPSL